MTKSAAVLAEKLRELENQYRTRSERMRKYADDLYFKDGRIVPEGNIAIQYLHFADDMAKILAEYDRTNKD